MSVAAQAALEQETSSLKAEVQTATDKARWLTEQSMVDGQKAAAAKAQLEKQLEAARKEVEQLQVGQGGKGQGWGRR